MLPQLRLHGRGTACALVPLLLFINPAAAQSPDFLHPQQAGRFRINGLSYLEFAVTGPQSGFTDPVNLGSGYSVPRLDEIITEIKATGTNLVKVNLSAGMVKNYNDNAYDPALAFPLDGTAADIIAFGQKLSAQGIPCYMRPFAGVENIVAGANNTNSTVQPTDRRAFMAQHIPRLVSLAQLAESMGCEYFEIFGDEIESLAADPNLTDLWVQAITEVRGVFSGRLDSEFGWGGGRGLIWVFPPQLISMLDVFGTGFAPKYTNHADPTVAELVSSYQNNADGVNILQTVMDMHTLYGKPILVSDLAYTSFTGSNVEGEAVLYGQFPRSQFTVDYQEQVNLYQAFFKAIPTLDQNWMLGSIFDSFDRYPYPWKDVFLPPYLGALGESLRGKPALQTLTQAYQTSQPLTVPANGWWFSPASPGAFYAVEAENGVVRLATLGYSASGGPLWSLARCAQTIPGTYVGTAEQYAGGWALNQTPTPPTGIADGPTVKLVFSTATTATLQIGTKSIPIQRYQFSNQWASPMLNAPRAGWWDQPSQSGRGYFVEVQGNTLFVGGLIYSSAGPPNWFTSTGPVDSSGNFSGSLTVCSASSISQAPVCKATADTVRLAFSAPWRAILTLSQEAPVEIRRYRQTEIGWVGPAPSFALPNPAFTGQAAAVNAGDYSAGLAPGTIATIFGTGLTRGVSGVVQASTIPLPFSIQGTSVLVNGIPAPLYAVANVNGQEQIDFQVPWEVQGGPIPEQPQNIYKITTQPIVSIVVVNNGALSPAMQALFYDLQPVILTAGAFAVAVHSDYSLVTAQSPAQTGETIAIYGIGFGAVTPQVATGAPAGSSPPSTMNTTPVISIGGQNATVRFSGLTPGSVDLYQFNFVVPTGLGSGNLPALISVGGQLSNIFSIPVQGQPGVQSELIQNGSFESPVNGTWFEYVDSTSAAAATFERTASTAHDGNYSQHVSVTNAGMLGNVQLGQQRISVVQGTTYEFQFWAKSTNARNLRVGVVKDGPDFHSYGLSTAFELGNTEWQLYRAVFQATETNSGRLLFYFGDQTGEVWLDGVSLIAVLGP